MKHGLRNTMALIGFGVFALCGTAQALQFTVSDITFTDLMGASENMQWSVSPVSVSPIKLTLTSEL